MANRPDRLGLDRQQIEDDDDDDFPAQRQGGVNVWLWCATVASIAATVFAGLSTADFIQHLDRQVHAIHCSVVPGAAKELGESGCRTVMMSPYSSLFRDSMWGGLPIALLALAVFSYLSYRGLDLALRKTTSKKDTAFFLASWLLPVAMTCVYAYVSTQLVGAVCTLCVGIYTTSGFGFVFAVLSHLKAPASPGGSAAGTYARWFFEGVAYVAVLVLVYLLAAPTNEKTLDGCGTLAKKDDPNQILLHFGGGRGAAKSTAVLDPLCPACKAFDHRLEVSGLRDKLDMDVVLFPLDKSCNWNLKESLHPGACAVAEAMLCAKEQAPAILDWAFENQESLIADAKADEDKMRARIVAKWPAVKDCIGTKQAKLKVTKSLKWAVANALPVLTPQLFIGDKRVCDEDTDLGLEYTVTAMLSRVGGKGGR